MNKVATGYDFRRTGGLPLVYVVRHGDTNLNDSGKFRGFIDVALNDKGKQEATSLGGYFKDKPIAAVYSSDLQRASHTAQAIAAPHEKQVMINNNLRPWDVGDLAGKDKQSNERVIDDHVGHPDKRLPGGESLREFQDRFSGEMEKIIDNARASGQTALVVAHASNAHEIGNLVNGDPDSGNIAPGGIMAIYEAPGRKLKLQIVKGEQADAGNKRRAS